MALLPPDTGPQRPATAWASESPPGRSKLPAGEAAISWEPNGREFFQALVQDIDNAGLTSGAAIAERMWTTDAPYVPRMRFPDRPRAFFHLLNYGVDKGRHPLLAEDDNITSVACAVRFTQALNKNIATRGNVHRCWPSGPPVSDDPGNVTFRGGALPEEYRLFFQPGVRFRCATFVATSFKSEIAEQFTESVPAGCPKVIWTVKFNPSKKCNHVNLMEVSPFHDEKEFLFTAYSAFQVEQVSWKTDPTRVPHEITLLAEPDNRDAPRNLPNVPWNM